jgi:hypothetical protein
MAAFLLRGELQPMPLNKAVNKHSDDDLALASSIDEVVCADDEDTQIRHKVAPASTVKNKHANHAGAAQKMMHKFQP